jgi:hypothetical protein
VGFRPHEQWRPHFRHRRHVAPRQQQLLPRYHDPHFTFRTADDRLVPRFHLDGVETGWRVEVFGIDPARGVRLATATVGEGGWVDLPEPIIVRPGGGFIAIPQPQGRHGQGAPPQSRIRSPSRPSSPAAAHTKAAIAAEPPMTTQGSDDCL